MQKKIIEKNVICPYCEKLVKVTAYLNESSKELAHCDNCYKRFRVYVNYEDYTPPLCQWGCEKGFAYIDTRNFVNGMKHEIRKVNKSGKLSKKVIGYREIGEFCEEEYIECLECKETWKTCFDEKGRLI